MIGLLVLAIAGIVVAMVVLVLLVLLLVAPRPRHGIMVQPNVAPPATASAPPKPPRAGKPHHRPR